MGHKDLLTSGQMAALNHVSKKALRVYQQKGILEPCYVDPDSGYQYYSHEQFSTLDAVRQMQGVGLSLAQIAQILGERDFDAIRAVLAQKTAELDAEARRIKLARHAVARLRDTCDLREHPPVCDVARLEWLPEQRIARFSVEPYDFEPYQTQENRRLRRWEMALRNIEGQFVERGIPLELFHNVGCIVSRESLANRAFKCTGGFVANDEGFGSLAQVWPAGHHLTVTVDTLFSPDGRHREHLWLCRLLNIADEHGWRVCGDYRSESLIESPAFCYEGRDMMMRLCLPVDVGPDAPNVPLDLQVCP